MSIKNSIIRFSTNFNNKLDCKFFSMMNISKKYEGKDHVLIEYKDKYKVASVQEMKEIKLWSLNHFMCRIDTGLSISEVYDLIGRQFDFDPMKENRTIYLYLIETKTDWITLPECHDILG